MRHLSPQSHERIQTRRSWTPEEDKRLIELVNQDGGNCWSQIATHLEGRVGKQCRERWRNHLDPNIRRDSFSPEDDDRILELVLELGTRWSKIAQRLAGRTENAVKNRYHCFLKNKDSNALKRSRDESSMLGKHKRVASDKAFMLNVFSDELGVSKSSPEGNYGCNLLGCGKQYTQLSQLLAHRLTHFSNGQHPSAQPGPLTPPSAAMAAVDHRHESAGEAGMLVRALDGLVDDLLSRNGPRTALYDTKEEDKDEDHGMHHSHGMHHYASHAHMPQHAIDHATAAAMQAVSVNHGRLDHAISHHPM